MTQRNSANFDSSKMAANNPGDMEKGFLTKLATELFTSPLNLALLGICTFLLYKIVGSRQRSQPSQPREPELPPLKKQDFTPEQLREYDGKANNGRILIAVNGKVFDVTKGKRFYGPGMLVFTFGLMSGLCVVRFVKCVCALDDKGEGVEGRGRSGVGAEHK